MNAANLNLGVIGNCQLSALIDGTGRYVWSCWPRLDGDPMFCALLRNDDNEDAQGFFSVDLQRCIRTEQTYQRNTAILETILTDDSGGSLRVIDFCPRFQQHGRLFRPTMIVRIIEPIAGRPVIFVRLRPLGQYGAQRPRRRVGSNHIRYEGEDLTLRLTTDASINAILEERALVLRGRQTFVLGLDEPIAESIVSLTQRFYEETRNYWVDWVRTLAIPFEWQEQVIRSAITLKLCSFDDSGAMLAAMTTSIPEAANSGRNWDYRFCWLRDSYFTIQALNGLGATRTMESYLRYIANVVAAADGDSLQPVYGISGEAKLTEYILDSLPGYRGMGPVRVGNQAHEQVQHDIYGAVILAAAQTFFDSRLHQPGDVELFHQLEQAGARCIALFDKPDAGIWEYRGRQRVHTFSSVMCWAGVDRLRRIAKRLQLGERAQYWAEHAALMKKTIEANAWNERLQCFSESWGDHTYDASVLLLQELGFIEAQDPRYIATVGAIERQLRRGDFLMRYNANDDFGAPENAFNICTFWYINALAAIGRYDEARALFENMLARCNSLGLLSEDLELKNGELWGNYPQTYSMVGIINAAMRLSCSWEDAL